MNPMQMRPRAEARVDLASPLSMAISENDRQTMAMVEQALRTKSMGLAYQPIVLSRDPTRTAFHEGLIRVMEPNGRIIPARGFMPAVEAHEIGREIDCVALECGLTTLARHPELRISINMSARSIGYPKWVRTLRKGLDLGVTVGERLILEITESSAMQVPELVIRLMDDLQPRGVAFALDDFGAGFTAIRYFKDFMFDILKIDGQFIRQIHRDPDNQALTRALISIGKHFEMVTVAEFVETPEEADCVRSLGFDCQQGYLYGAPTMKPAWEKVPERRQA